jgi:DNA-binding HxlR family transcriptional regulator
MMFRSDCPIASALDIVGDRWSLVVIRNLMLGARSYGDLLKAREKIATNILSDRLARLEAAGLVAATSPKATGARGGYRLTRSGGELLPVLQQLALWGERHLPGREETPEWFLQATLDDVLDRGVGPFASQRGAEDRSRT